MTGMLAKWINGAPHQTRYLGITLLAATALIANGQRVWADPIAISNIDRSQPVDFQQEVLPILRKNCLACHSTSERQGELVLETPAEMLKGGDSGPAIVAKKSAESLLLRLAAHQDEPVMPPADNDVAAKSLTPRELGLIKLWIDQGAIGKSATASLSPTRWRPLPAGVNPIFAVAVTPDGQYAACGRANQIFIYHVPSGQLVTRLTDPSLQVRTGDPRPGVAHLDLVQALAFNRDGDMLASGGFRTVKLWRRPSDVMRLKANSSHGAVQAVAVSPDRKTLAIGAGDEVQVWDLASGKRSHQLSGHREAVTGLKFDREGQRLYSSSLDRTVRTWSLANGNPTGRLDLPAPINAIELVELALQESADLTECVAVGDAENLVRIYRTPDTAVPLPNVTAAPTAMAVSADGEVQAVAGGQGEIRILDAAGNVKHQWTVPGGAVHCLALHPLVNTNADTDPPPRPLLATGGGDGAIRLWDYTTGTQVDVMQGTRQPITALAFRGDGGELAAGTDQGAIAVWNLAGNSPELAEEVVAQPSNAVAVSADGKRLATAGTHEGRPAIVVFDLPAMNVSHRLLGHAGPVRALAFRADGSALVSGSADKTARIWDLNDKAAPEKTQFTGHAADVTAVAFSANGQQALSGAGDHSLKLWNAADGTEIKAFAGHAGSVVGVAFRADGHPVSASSDKTIRIWNPADGKSVRTIADTHALTAMAMARDGGRVAVAGADHVIRLYQLNDGKKLASLEGQAGPVVELAFDPAGMRLVASSSAEFTVWDGSSASRLETVAVQDLAAAVWGPGEGQLLTVAGGRLARREVRFVRPLPGGAKNVTALAYHPNGQSVYASFADGTLRAFRTTDGQQAYAANHGAAIHDAALSPDGQFLVTAGEDKVLKIWTAANGRPAPTPVAPLPSPVTSVTFSGDGQRVLAGADGEVRAFTFASRKLEQSFAEQPGVISTVASFGSTGFASLSEAGTIHRRELQVVKLVPGHSQPVTSLAVMPTDRKQLFSASLDGTVRHWSLDTGRQIRQFSHGGPVESIAVRPDGMRLASVSNNHTARLWNVQNGQRIAELKGDLRAKTEVTRRTQDLTAATARRDAAKRSLDAAEKDVPVKEKAAKEKAEALAAAKKDAEAKQATLTKVTAEKVAAEKLAIDAAAAAQRATVAKSAADQAAAELDARLAQERTKAQRLATLVQQSPEDAQLVAAKEASDKQVAELTKQAAAAKAAQAAPAKALAEASKGVTDAAAKVTATQKPYNDAVAALRPALANQVTAEQLNTIAARELEVAKQLVPTSTASLAEAEAALKAAQAAVDEAKQAATATEQPLRAVAFSPDGTQLATGGDFPAVHCWDAETGAATKSFVGHQAAIGCLAFVSDQELVSGSADEAAVVWEVNPGWELAHVIGDVNDPSRLVNRVLSLDFNRAGTLLATGSGEPSRSGEVKVWSVADGSLVQNFVGAHDDTVHGVRFSPDGKVLATCGADKYIRTFDVASGQLLRRFEGHTHHVLGVAWQGGGQVLASAGADGVVKIWNAQDGDQTRTISGFKKQVTSLRFIGDTTDIATSAGDPLVRTVRSTNGGTIRNFGGVADFMHSVDVTPDGAVLVAGGHDSVLRIWNGTNGQVLKSLEPPTPEPAAQDEQVADK